MREGDLELGGTRQVVLRDVGDQSLHDGVCQGLALVKL